MTTLTPDQLPNNNAQFVAYGNPTRVADPFGGDEALSVRPQVFVRYYRGIKIKDLATPNEDTIHVVLDPESVGLSKEFGAYMNSDDPVVPYLREQFEAGNPVDVGLEYVRRQKAKSSKAEISPVAPIHALRGANSPDGSGDNHEMMGASGNHIRAIVGMVNGRRTTVTESDPREWKMLTGNRKGDLPPEGWKALLDRDDWTKVGAITPKGGVTPMSTPGDQQTQQGGGGQGLDMNALSKIIGHEVRKGLKDYGEYLLRQEDATRGTPTSQAPSSSSEGKPWNVWVNKNQLNLGSYLVSGEGYSLRWAYTYLGTLNDDVLTADSEMRWEAARELSDATGKIADRVQATAYNGEVRADRTSASFKEAALWVRFHIENSHPFGVADDFDYEQWFSNVGRAATISLKDAEASAADYLSERYPRAEEETTQNPAEPETEKGADEQAPSTEEDRAPVVTTFLQLLTQQWTSKDGILNLAREAKEKGLLDVSVWANPYEGQFSTEPFDGGRELTIGDLTKHQFSLLSQADDSGEANTAPSAPSANSADVPPREEETASQEESPAHDPAPAATPNPNGRPQRTAQHIAAALAKATTEEQIGASYTEARDLNLLTSEISVQHGSGPFGLTPVPPTTEGAETMTLAAVFDALRAAIEGTTAPAEQTQPDAESSEVDGSPESTTEAPAADAEEEEAASSAEEQPAEPAQADEAPADAEQDAPASADDKPSATGGSGDSTSLAQSIAERAAVATTTDEINALYEEASSQGVEGEIVTIKSGNGPLAGFLKSRQKRIARNG